MILLIFCFFWGFAEALWFFIIPDIILSYLALKNIKSILFGLGLCIVGAMLGAVCIYGFLKSSDDPTITAHEIAKFWSLFPGFYTKMLTTAEAHMVTDGAKGLLLGPTSGIPYRFYVLQAYLQNVPLIELLLWTPLARLQRIIIAPAVVFVINQLLNRWAYKKIPITQKILSPKIFMGLILLYWIGIYIWYWGMFLPQTYQ